MSRYLSSQFNIAARGYLGELGYFNIIIVAGRASLGNFCCQTMGFEVIPSWKFSEKDNAMFAPYITLRLGLRRISMPDNRLKDFGIFGTDKSGIYEFTIPAGLGVNVRLTERFGLNLQSNYMWTNNKSENTLVLEQLTYNQAWFNTIGITMNLCKVIDTDGIEDNLDKCPKVFGVAANNGCPEVKAAVKQLFEKALQGVQFETGKSVLKPNSFAILNNVVKVMIENPTYKLYILGHTDNVGDAAKNLKLSQERAAAVEKFLESKGVNTLRVRSEGFGDTKPAYDNTTTEGKTKNRRVEFKVEFEE